MVGPDRGDGSGSAAHGSMIWLANPRDMVGTELDVIAAVVLGGRGSVPGVILALIVLMLPHAAVERLAAHALQQLFLLFSIALNPLRTR